MIARFISLATFCLLVCSCSKNTDSKKWIEPASPFFDSALKPFFHGVASGDPLPNSVILWTRITPEDSVQTIHVKWEVSGDESFSSILKSDTLSTSPDKDFTVKVDVNGLQPNHFYYYRFYALGKNSVTGRTKTAPVDMKDSLRFAVVSCSNWEFGYYNAYDRIAEKEVDAVIHLGDYIYEYATGIYGDTTIGRKFLPIHECVTLEDYRIRYSQGHLDKGLLHLRMRHPLITIWDDHEFANNVYAEGAQNHQAGEGNFAQRKAAAKKAYYEWLPIREDHKHYRSFSFGPLVDVLMLDERIEGRTAPVDSTTSPEFFDENRSMLGKDQLKWFEEKLRRSTASWKIIGNQVIFSDLNIEGLYGKGMPKNLDAWDGYPTEKNQLENFMVDNKIQNIVFLSGDTHASWAIEVPFRKSSKRYTGSIAVELGTTSISSGNGDDGNPVDSVLAKENHLLKMNPHVKFLNNRDHGYLLISVYPERINAQWYYVKTLREIENTEFLGKHFQIDSGKSQLR